MHISRYWRRRYPRSGKCDAAAVTGDRMHQPRDDRTHHATDYSESEQSEHDQPAPAGIRLVVLGAVFRVLPRPGQNRRVSTAQRRHAAGGARDGGDRVECCRTLPRQHCDASEDARRDDHGAAERAALSLEAPGDCSDRRDHHEHDDGHEEFVQRAQSLNRPLFDGPGVRSTTDEAIAVRASARAPNGMLAS